MFKYLIFFAAVALSAAAIPRSNNYGSQHSSSSHTSGDDAHAEIKALHSDVRENGFDYALETSNGIHTAQSGDEHGNVHGEYEYVSPEGEHVKVTYIADENGYQPQSDLLPTAPPIPPAILKALEYIRTHPPKEEPSYHHSASSNTPSYARPAAFGRHR